MDLGTKLFELRKQKNLTQDEVAEKLNVTRQTVSKWETNQSTPDFDKISPLCSLYGISPNELLNDETTESNNTFNLDETKKHFFTKEKEDKIDYENMSKSQVKAKTAEVVSSSIFMFLLAIVFLIVGSGILKWSDSVVASVFLLIVGIGVTRIIRHYMSIPKFEKTEKEEKQDRIVKQINDIIGGIGVAIYFIVSFITMAWHITWVIFIIIGMLESVVKLIFMLKDGDEDEE